MSEQARWAVALLTIGALSGAIVAAVAMLAGIWLGRWS